MFLHYIFMHVTCGTLAYLVFIGMTFESFVESAQNLTWENDWGRYEA